MRDGVSSIPTATLLAQWQTAQAMQDADARAQTAALVTELRAKLQQLEAEIARLDNGSFYTKSESDAAYYRTDADHAAGSVLAAPAGAEGTASFRRLIGADLPAATKSTLGGVKPGEHCSISADGTLTPDTAYLDLSDDRPKSANIDFSKPAYQGRLTYTLASSSMTTGKPTHGESYLLSLGWDVNNAGSQIALRTGTNPHLQIRGKGSSTEYGDWVTIVDSANIKSYLNASLSTLAAAQSDTDGLLVDQEYRQTLLELGVEE